MDKNEQHWYAAKVKYQTEKKIHAWLDEINVEHFIPLHTVMVERAGKKKKKEKPLVPGLLFIRTNRRTALLLPAESQIRINYMRHLETHQLLIVPDKQMQDFMFLLDFSESAVRIENANLKKGDRVRVIKGDFAGIEGELIRIKGHKRVVVRLEGLFSLATTYIPGAYLEKI
ncbi:MAG: UpxY family transcription antiterminator [Dysgonamonadaceae bacterium]|jgi:transcription antitermination factor NusG|nr:UpxY family transcription antiterminator [Dysgonamonadaceae bacterium]